MLKAPPCVIFTFSKLYKWDKIAQNITYVKWGVYSSARRNTVCDINIWVKYSKRKDKTTLKSY